jgi:hypothetical protein
MVIEDVDEVLATTNNLGNAIIPAIYRPQPNRKRVRNARCYLQK